MPTATAAKPNTDVTERIRALIDQAPPLTPENRDRIAALFKAGRN